MTEESLIYRLRKRAEIRRNIPTRKSVQEGKPDRLADLLDEAANEIERLERKKLHIADLMKAMKRYKDRKIKELQRQIDWSNDGGYG